MICEFIRKHRFLSNFSPSIIRMHQKPYPTAEHLFQALKTNDLVQRENIRCSLSPGIAKQKGQRVTLRPGWEKIKDGIMLLIIKAKFDQNCNLVQRLVDTYPNELVEGNYWHDNYWGDCLCDKCSMIEGQNKLGNILVIVRGSQI